MDRSYNWDDLEVGRYDLNHSERFFSRKHEKHERFASDMFEAENKENIQENAIEICKKAADSTSDVGKKTQKVLQRSNSLSVLVNQLVSSSLTESKSQNNLGAKIGLEKAKTKETCKEIAAPGHAKTKRTIGIGPSVCKYVEIYKKHKDQMIQKKLQNEMKQKQFHSKPAPNFNAIHKKKQEADRALHLTTPQTPLVYKRSKEIQERKNKMMEEITQKQKSPKFTSRRPRVIAEEPFKPKKSGRKIEPAPFDLHMEKRLQDRKHFNENVKRIMEEKKRQEEEKKKTDEEEMVRKLRKATAFKAQPNPFRLHT